MIGGDIARCELYEKLQDLMIYLYFVYWIRLIGPKESGGSRNVNCLAPCIWKCYINTLATFNKISFAKTTNIIFTVS